MSSKPLFSLAAHFARRKGETVGRGMAEMPPRPDGIVIWVWATDPDQVFTLKGLEAQLAADGDRVSLVITLPDRPDYLAEQVIEAPANRSETQAFLTHWRPALVLWMRDGLEPATLVELADQDVPCILLEAMPTVLRPNHGGWVPGLGRAMLQQFKRILTVDATVSTQLLRSGADPNKVEPLGVMETAAPAMTHFEDERQEMAKLLGSRPIWLAADSSPAEAEMLATAHHQASLRSHRLLLIITLTAEEDGPKMAQLMRDRGFLVALRSLDEPPDEAIQVYIADYEGEMGLWYRLSPITYLGGSLSGGPCRNPYEAATLGSALLHGPDIAPYHGQISRLTDANASVPMTMADELGKEVESMLAPDKTALIVHAAWEVTSRGAEVTSRIAEIVIAELDEIGV